MAPLITLVTLQGLVRAVHFLVAHGALGVLLRVRGGAAGGVGLVVLAGGAGVRVVGGSATSSTLLFLLSLRSRHDN